MNIEEVLSQRINMPQINNVVSWASGNLENRCLLWSLVRTDDRRTRSNALWAMTHMAGSDSEWILSLRDELIDLLLIETDTGIKRMLLQILRGLEYDAYNIRSDFLDFCMSKINSEYEPYAIRCSSIYAAFEMCRFYPELIAELEEYLDMMPFQSLSPGLKSALRQTKMKIRKLRKTF